MNKATIATVDTKLDGLIDSMKEQGEDIKTLTRASVEHTEVQKQATLAIEEHHKTLYDAKTGLTPRMEKAEGPIRFAVRAFWIFVAACLAGIVGAVIGGYQYVKAHITGP